MIFDDQISDPKAKAGYHAIRERMAKLLHDANQLAIDIFDVLRKKKEHQTTPVAHATAVLLARHAIEMADGVAVLVAKGCAEPCKALLRSQLEASMGLLYILKEDSDRRDLAYQLAHAHKNIKLYLKYDSNTAQGKTFAAEMKGDDLWQALKPTALDWPKMIQNLESMLRRPDFVPIEAEWQRMKQPKPMPNGKMKVPDDPHWYALFNGPANVRDLAKRLDMRGEYEYLYRFWSDTIHAGGAMSQVKPVVIDGSTQQIMVPVRNPQHLQQCVMVCVGMLLKVCTALIERYVPEVMGEFAARYISDVQQRYMSLANAGPIIQVPWS